MIAHLRLLIVTLLFVAGFAQAEGNCQKNDSVAIIKVFNQGIALNEQFKRALRDDLDKVMMSRNKIEQFQENVLSPCMERAVKVLSGENNQELMHKFLDVVVSFENSSDEMTAYSLGMIFGKNPDLLETSLQRFPPSKRKLLVKRLKLGWLNAKLQFKDDVVSDREKRLNK